MLTLHLVSVVATALLPASSIGLRRAHDDRVICVSLDMFLQILWALERFPAELAFVRLQWNVDANV